MKEIKAQVIDQTGEIGYCTASAFCLIIEKFFKNPENNAKFEAWKAEQEHKADQNQPETTA